MSQHNEKETPKILPIISMKEASDRALTIIDNERSGKQLGLYTRYSNLNRAFGKYMRFGLNTLLAGTSGSGKSTLLNLIIQDFTALRDYEISYDNADGMPVNYTIPAINKVFYGKHMHIHFAFEMSAFNEILRMVSSQTGLSYNEILSSKFNKETRKFDKLTGGKYKMVKNILDLNHTRPIVFIELAGNVYEIYNTIYHIFNHYTKLGIETISISLDHTLLTDKLDEKSAMEIIANLAKGFIKVRKDFNACSILVSQLNGKIQTIERKINPALHLPTEEDIYGSKEVNFAMDNIMINHNPSKIGIESYTVANYDGTDLLHGAVLKQRFGKIGSIWFKKDFARTNILEYETGIPPTFDATAISFGNS